MDVSRRRALGGLLGVAGASLVGCADQAAAPAASTGAASTPTRTQTQTSRPTSATTSASSATPTPTTTSSSAAPARPTWPLTGEPVGDASKLRHAAVGVKVPDTQGEHPQVGLDKADIVFVEMDGYRDAAGYSSTRLLPVFHSRMPDAVGPVRSLRPVDVPLLSPMHAIVGNTGGAGWVLNYVEQADAYVEGMLSYMNTRGTGSYSIDPRRVRVLGGVTYYDRAVLCHPTVLARQSRTFSTAPPMPYFPFAADAAGASTATGSAARTIRVPWKGNDYAMSYAYDSGTRTYLRSMPWGRHVLANGVRVAPDNVLVIRAGQTYRKLVSGRGAVEPVHEIMDARGSFFYFHGGRGVTGTWAKTAINERFSLTLDSGEPLRMAPGQTYVELVATRAPVTFKA